MVVECCTSLLCNIALILKNEVMFYFRLNFHYLKPELNTKPFLNLSSFLGWFSTIWYLNLILNASCSYLLFGWTSTIWYLNFSYFVDYFLYDLICIWCLNLWWSNVVMQDCTYPYVRKMNLCSIFGWTFTIWYPNLIQNPFWTCRLFLGWFSTIWYLNLILNPSWTYPLCGWTFTISRVGGQNLKNKS